ncbi:hypothetical protein [Micromonospora endophytica]|uniref:hypothetical protein n=1 Tax=Micromonospora endophytica TaxID=515350 RepID=UPI0015E8BC5C|nr:hypothetical protein [Micromonospora endophytica]
MSVRRQAARLGTVCVLLGGLVLLGAAPAHADEDRVRVQSAGSFTAGRSAEGVTVEVRRRTDGCVRVRGVLGLSLPGVRANQVAVQANLDGRWVPVAVSGDNGLLVTSAVAPEKDELCRGKRATMRYRVAFGADAPDGRLIVTGEVVTADGAVLGRAAADSRVVGGRVAPTRSASPTPSPTPSEDPVEEPTAEVTPTVALAAEGTGDAADAGDLAQTSGESAGGSPVMYFGIAMVAAGVLLIGLLIARSRKDRRQRREQAEVPLPRSNPGGTTYRSGRGAAATPIPPGPAGGPVPPGLGAGPISPGHGGVPVPPQPRGPGAVAPGSPGQVYGSSRPGTPRVYGGPSAPRPSGGLYGARPADPGDQGQATPEPSAASAAVPPPAASPAAPAHPVSAPPAAPTSAPPASEPGTAPTAPTSAPPATPSGSPPAAPSGSPPAAPSGSPPAAPSGQVGRAVVPRRQETTTEGEDPGPVRDLSG